MLPAPDIDLVLHAVGDPRRRALLERVSRSDGISVVELTQDSGVTQGAISQHLKILKAAGLVVGQAQGRNVFYRAQPQGLAPLFDWLSLYEGFWHGRLANLRSLLAETDE